MWRVIKKEKEWRRVYVEILVDDDLVKKIGLRRTYNNQYVRRTMTTS